MAVFLGSHQTDRSIEGRVRAGEFSIVYVTPEKLVLGGSFELLHAMRDKLALVAVDEAHCIAEWGSDFRCVLACVVVLQVRDDDVH